MKINEYISKKLGHNDFKVLFDDKTLETRINSLAKTINRDLQDSDPLVVIGVLKGSFIFVADLVRKLTMPVHVEFITASSYLKTQSSGSVQIHGKDIFPDLQGKEVLLVEDIIDTGLTLQTLVDFIKSKNASKIHICSLFIKPEKVKIPIQNVKYVGFSLGDSFIIGYGLDYEQKYRELPCIIELNKLPG